VKKNKLSRNEKSRLTKDRLYHSTIQVIAQYGFEKASVARITQHADVSIGTFYNYFKTREALLEQVVLSQGQELRRSISEIIVEGTDFFDREEQSFRQYFRFLKKYPHYIQLLNEAEIFLPGAYNELISHILEGYRKVLRDSSDAGEISRLHGIEVDGVALMLIAARHYYGQFFLQLCGHNGELPDYIVAIYMRVIKGGLKPEETKEPEQSITSGLPGPA